MAPSFGPISSEIGKVAEVDEDTKSYEEIVYEEIWTLNYHGNLNIRNAWNLPVGARRWWLHKTSEAKQKEKEAAEKAKSGNKRKFEAGSGPK